MSKVAIIIDNLVQFYSIKGLIDDLSGRGIKNDLFIFQASDAEGLTEATVDKVAEMGYSSKTCLKKKEHYKVVLEPYPKIEWSDSFRNNLSYDYRLKYKYSLVSAKPDPVYTPAWNYVYDEVLVYTVFEKNILNTYTKTRLVKPSKYNYAKLKYTKQTKKRMLYLPTFNDIDPRDYKGIETAFNELKKSYIIIVKAHHATQFRSAEKRHVEFLQEIADEMYDQTMPLASILSTADVVLTGNSGSIYEALYMKVPVAVFSSSLNQHNLGEIKSFHSKLIGEGIIPATSDTSAIPLIIQQTMARLPRQLAIRDEQFESNEYIYESMTDVVEGYMQRDAANDLPHLLHIQMIDYVNNIKAKNKKLLDEKSKLEIRNTSLKEHYEQRVASYENSLSWKVTKVLRVAHKILRMK